MACSACSACAPVRMLSRPRHRTSGAPSEVRQLSDQELRAAMAAAASGKAPSTATNREFWRRRPRARRQMFHPQAGRLDSRRSTTLARRWKRKQKSSRWRPDRKCAIGITLQMVPTARIEGTIMTADGQPVPVAGAQVMLQRSTGFSTSSYFHSHGRGRTFSGGWRSAWPISVDREMDTTGTTSSPDSPDSRRSTTSGSRNRSGRHRRRSAGITLALSPPLTFSGKVVFEGRRPPVMRKYRFDSMAPDGLRRDHLHDR